MKYILILIISFIIVYTSNQALNKPGASTDWKEGVDKIVEVRTNGTVVQKSLVCDKSTKKCTINEEEYSMKDLLNKAVTGFVPDHIQNVAGHLVKGEIKPLLMSAAILFNLLLLGLSIFKFVLQRKIKEAWVPFQFGYRTILIIMLNTIFTIRFIVIILYFMLMNVQASLDLKFKTSYSHNSNNTVAWKTSLMQEHRPLYRYLGTLVKVIIAMFLYSLLLIIFLVGCLLWTLGHLELVFRILYNLLDGDFDYKNIII